MGLFSRKKVPDENSSIEERLGIKLHDPFPHTTFRSDGRVIHIPIWYVFKNGNRIDLNHPSLKIDDWTGKYNFERLRKLGHAKIKAWEKLNEGLPMGKSLAVPEIVFYE